MIVVPVDNTIREEASINMELLKPIPKEDHFETLINLRNERKKVSESTNKIKIDFVNQITQTDIFKEIEEVRAVKPVKKENILTRILKLFFDKK
jgi:hypothetical protein